MAKTSQERETPMRAPDHQFESADLPPALIGRADEAIE
jgi:hypothetical protein